MTGAHTTKKIGTPARWLWLLLLVPAVYLFPQLALKRIAKAARCPSAPLAHELWPEGLLLLIGCLALLIAGRIRAGTARAYLPYVLPLAVLLLSVGNFLMFPEAEMSRSGWQFIRKNTGSLTEGALKSPSHFHRGGGKLCLMLRDYIGDHTLVTHVRQVKDICRTSYLPLILPDLVVEHKTKAMTVTPATAEYLMSLPGDEITVSDGTRYRFVRQEMAKREKVLHLVCREVETHFFVPHTLYRDLNAGTTGTRPRAVGRETPAGSSGSAALGR